MNSKQPKFTKNAARAATGGVAVVVALLLAMFFKGGGLGSGDGDGETTSSGDSLASTDVPENNSTEITPGNSESTPVAPLDGGLTPDEKLALADDVLEIMIDEYSYFLVVPDTETIYRPMELPQLLKLAERASGDANGIRVRITRRETSRTKAEVDLKTALAEIGIGDDAVYMPEQLLPK